jgi:hypothetical protein
MNERDIIGKIISGRDCSSKLLGHRLYKNDQNKFFYVIPKKDFFHNYGQFFEKTEMPGESINLEALQTAVENDATIVFIYSRYIRIIYSKTFNYYAKEHKTIRNTKQTNENTASVPLWLMRTEKRTF